VPIHFTDLSIRSLREGVYFDDRTPSFGIRVGKNRRTWLVLKGDNRTKVRLGHYPALGLADARRKALIALGSPFEPADAPTFPEARQEFLAQDRWKESSRYEIARNLNRYFLWTKTKGIKVSDAQLAAVNLSRHSFHGDWNYTIAPKRKTSQRRSTN
jgi:hypothetical protein